MALQAGRTLQEQEWEIVHGAIARLRARIMAVVFAMMGGTGLLVATVWLLVKGGTNVGVHLNLLGNYLPGYSVTWGGALLGFVYGALLGAVVGGSVAWIYNQIADRRHPV